MATNDNRNTNKANADTKVTRGAEAPAAAEVKNVPVTVDLGGEIQRGRKTEAVSENEAGGDQANLVTTKEVEFTINGKHFKGTQFSVESQDLEARKKMLQEAYGQDIIKE